MQRQATQPPPHRPTTPAKKRSRRTAAEEGRKEGDSGISMLSRILATLLEEAKAAGDGTSEEDDTKNSSRGGPRLECRGRQLNVDEQVGYLLDVDDMEESPTRGRPISTRIPSTPSSDFLAECLESMARSATADPCSATRSFVVDDRSRRCSSGGGVGDSAWLGLADLHSRDAAGDGGDDGVETENSSSNIGNAGDSSSSSSNDNNRRSRASSSSGAVHWFVVTESTFSGERFRERLLASTTEGEDGRTKAAVVVVESPGTAFLKMERSSRPCSGGSSSRCPCCPRYRYYFYSDQPRLVARRGAELASLLLDSNRSRRREGGDGDGDNRNCDGDSDDVEEEDDDDDVVVRVFRCCPDPALKRGIRNVLLSHKPRNVYDLWIRHRDDEDGSRSSNFAFRHEVAAAGSGDGAAAAVIPTEENLLEVLTDLKKRKTATGATARAAAGGTRVTTTSTVAATAPAPSSAGDAPAQHPLPSGHRRPFAARATNCHSNCRYNNSSSSSSSSTRRTASGSETQSLGSRAASTERTPPAPFLGDVDETAVAIGPPRCKIGNGGNSSGRAGGCFGGGGGGSANSASRKPSGTSPTASPPRFPEASAAPAGDDPPPRPPLRVQPPSTPTAAAPFSGQDSPRHPQTPPSAVQLSPEHRVLSELAAIVGGGSSSCGSSSRSIFSFGEGQEHDSNPSENVDPENLGRPYLGPVVRCKKCRQLKSRRRFNVLSPFGKSKACTKCRDGNSSVRVGGNRPEETALSPLTGGAASY